MRLRVYPTASLSADEMKLAEKARRAAADYMFRMIDSRGGAHAVMSVGAYILDEPLRLDFEISSEQQAMVGGIGTFIGPNIELTENSFEGDLLKPSVWAQVSDAFDVFAADWQRKTA